MKITNRSEEKTKHFGTNPKRKGDIELVVVHQPGKGPGIAKIMSDKKMSRFEAVCEFYVNRSKIGEHFAIGTEGQITLITPVNRVAYHCKTEGYRTYGDAESFQRDPMFKWWCERFHGVFKTPLDMPFWRPGPKGTPTGVINERSVGICLVPGEDDKFTHVQTDAFWDLVIEVGMSPPFVYTHSEVHPYARTARNKPYDLSPSQREQLDHSYNPGGI